MQFRQLSLYLSLLTCLAVSSCAAPPPKVRADVPMVSSNARINQTEFKQESNSGGAAVFSKEGFEIEENYTSASNLECVKTITVNEKTSTHFCFKSSKWVQLPKLFL